MIPVPDIIFLGGCVTLIVQLKIAGYLIKNMDYGKDATQTKSFVETYSKILKLVYIQYGKYHMTENKRIESAMKFEYRQIWKQCEIFIIIQIGG